MQVNESLLDGIPPGLETSNDLNILKKVFGAIAQKIENAKLQLAIVEIYLIHSVKCTYV